MSILIMIILVAIIIGLLIETFVLQLSTKIFNIENSTFKKSIKISSVFLVSTLVLGVIIGKVFDTINAGWLGAIIVFIASFFIANVLYKKYYQTDLKRNLSIYVVKFFIGAIVEIILLFLVIIPIRTYVTQPFFIEGVAMLPNFNDGEYALFKIYDKNYQRGDVIVLIDPKKSNDFLIKRIIGLPGEKIDINQGVVSVNGKVLNESSYLPNNVKTNGIVNAVLGNDQYFVMGDNREFSMDSRAFGVVNKNLIIAKYWVTLKK